VSRNALIAVIAGAVVVVAALAAITPTVLVDDNDGHGVRVMRVVGPPGIGPGPFRIPAPEFAPGPFRFRECERRNGAKLRCRGFAPALPGR
jgi:hypothetical protein